MKRRLFFIFILLLVVAPSVEILAQGMQEKEYVQLTEDFPKYIPIYDIIVNTDQASSTDQSILATFTDGQNEIILNSGTNRGLFDFGRGLAWSFYINQGGKNKKIKLEKNGDERRLNLAKHKIGPVYLKEIQINFLVENVYVQIEKDGYYYLLKYPSLAIPFFQAKAEEGDVRSMDIYAELLFKYGSINENNQAFSWFKRAADKGDDHANVGMAKCYLEGVGVSRDTTKAESLLLMSKMDNVDAKTTYAKLLYKRRANDLKVEDLCIESANAGSIEAMRILIDLYKKTNNYNSNLNVIDLYLRLLELGDMSAFKDVWDYRFETYSNYITLKNGRSNDSKVLKNYNSERYYSLIRDTYGHSTGRFDFNRNLLLTTHFKKDNEYAILAAFDKYIQESILERPENDEFLHAICGLNYDKIWREILHNEFSDYDIGKSREIVATKYHMQLLKNHVVPKLKIMADNSADNKLEAIRCLIKYYKKVDDKDNLIQYVKKGSILGDDECLKLYERLF